MLTRAGWLVAAGAIGLVAAGRFLGLEELFVLGAACGILLAAAAIWVSRARFRLEVARSVTPARVHAGNASRVDLAIRNVGTRRTPVLRFTDPVSRTRGAEILIAPFSPLASTNAAYQLPTDRRGVVRVGPLRVEVSDPFGLARTSTVAAGRTEVIVYPRIDRIVPLPQTAGHDPLAGSEHPTALGRAGEDFYALRPYVVGDELRRVHWPTTARLDELMVRQDELPWQGRVTVLLDVRRPAHSPASLELCISAAASIVMASWKRHDLIRLLSSDGTDTGFGSDGLHVEGILEHLAVLESVPIGTFRPMIANLARTGGGGALVAVVAHAPEAELAGLSRLQHVFGWFTLVEFDRSSWDAGAIGRPPLATSGHIVVTRDQPFGPGWNQAMKTRTRTGGLLGPVAGAPGGLRLPPSISRSR
ncbi:MAG: DUF58 domain-containing protein [Acidimicrobiales bacterium]